MTPDPNSETIDLAIAEVIGKWLEQPVSERPSPETLMNMHPHLGVGLAECLHALKFLESGMKNEVMLDSFELTGEQRQKQDAPRYPEIPDFVIQAELGRGGMGIVYDAKQVSLGRTVALKVLPIGSVDPQSIQRFQREAEMVAALSHPGIVPIFAVGVHNGLHWYAMHKVDGCPLSQWFANLVIESRHAIVHEVVRIGIEAAEALAHAHQRGIIHRDIKPGNLLVEKSGKVWLTDFGLARRELDVTATATGAMLGTPLYMSAEQISNREDLIDARTDIYSLGATLYEMATGRPPFLAQTPLELMTQIQRDEPLAPRKLTSLIPIPLELVILKCLDKDPQRRYPTATSLSDDLRAVRDHQPIQAKGLPLWLVASRFFRRNQRQISAIATSVLTTLTAMAVIVLLWQQNRQAMQGHVRIQSPASLYIANIYPKSQDSSATNVAVTTPMQQPVSLIAGDYSIRMDGIGRPSQLLDLRMNPGDTVDFQYVDRREELPEIDKLDKLALPLSDGALAVLGKESLGVFEAGGSARFQLPIAQLDQHFQSPDAQSIVSGDPPLTFAYTPEQTYQGDFNVDHSGFARIERICQKHVDLDGDGKADLLLVASRHAALTALSHAGEVLWTKRLQLAFESATFISKYPKGQMPNEAIVGISPIGDVNDDGIADLVVNTAIFDPSGFSRPTILTLSGRNGATIAETNIPTTNMQMIRDWPWSGLLRHRRDFNTDNRVMRNMNHHVGRSLMRSQTSSLQNTRWAGTANSALYVLPPLVFGEHEGRKVAATAIGDSIYFFDIINGQAVGEAIKLPGTIGCGPMKVELGNGRWGVAVGATGNAWTSYGLHLCILGENTPRWSVTATGTMLDYVASASASSFPMVIDLDHDGVDEIITTSNVTPPFTLPKMLCFSSIDGSVRWSSDNVAGIAAMIDQAMSVDDIDNDEFDDVAVVGICSLSDAIQAPEWQGVHLVVDFLSGKTGKRLGYRKERISGEIKNYGVVEIDSLQRQGHELVCSVVYGAPQELHLTSTTIAINLSSWEPAVQLRGLTRVGGPTTNASFQEGWYRRRSGEFAKPSDTMVWVSPTRFHKLFAGETLVESWVSSKGEPRMLLAGHQFVRCINPVSGTTLWQTKLDSVDVTSVRCVPGKDGETDLLISKSNYFEALPELWDAETGQPRFAISDPPMGEIRNVYPAPENPDRFLYAFANATYVKKGNFQKQNQGGLVLFKLDRADKELVWSKLCYESINFDNEQTLPSKIVFHELNGDGVQDVISGSTKDGEMVIEALDGKKGTSIWTHTLTLLLDPSVTPWGIPWPMYTLVSREKGEDLVVVDAVAGNPSAFELKYLELSTGRVRARYQKQIQFPILQAVRSGQLTIATVSPSSTAGLLGVRAFSPNNTDRWTVLKAREGTVEPEEIAQYPIAGNLRTGDFDGDGILDLVTIQNQNVQVRRSDTYESTGAFPLPNSAYCRRIDVIDDKSYLVCSIQNQEGHVWYELPSGKVALESGEGFVEFSRPVNAFPRLLRHSSGTWLVGSTQESPQCMNVDFGSRPFVRAPKATGIAMLDSSTDFRYRKPVEALGVYQGKSLAEAIELGLIALVAILVPIAYLVGLMLDRQWSLRRLLFGPIVTMVAIFAWRIPFLHEGPGVAVNMFAGVFFALSIFSIAILIRGHRWGLLGICCVLCMIMGTLMMYLAHTLLTNNTPGIVGYWTIGNWAWSCLAACFQIIVPIACGQLFLKKNWMLFRFKKENLLAPTNSP